MSIADIFYIVVTAPIPEFVFWGLGIVFVIGFIGAACSAVKENKKEPKKKIKVYGEHGYKEVEK